MSTEYRYILEKGNKKHHCPACSKKRFVKYLDTHLGEYLPQQYGRCDRESKCGQHLNPYNDGYAKAFWEHENGNTVVWQPSMPKADSKPTAKPKTTFIPDEVFEQTRGGYDKNVFIQNLLGKVDFPFDVKDVEKVIGLYHLGTVQNGYRKGAITFPFIDINGKVRTIQVKQFDKTNHTVGTDFLHSMIEKHHIRNNKPIPNWLQPYNDNETKVSCLFGEHLLIKYPNNPIALVEAPKTAIYGTLYFGVPEQSNDLLWLAVYNLSSLNLNKCKELKGRNVYLFPDLSKDGSAFDLWSKKANEIQKHLRGATFRVSDLLEQLAPQQDKKQGKDLADYLITQDWRKFRKLEHEPIKGETISAQGFDGKKTPLTENGNENLIKPDIEKPENWCNDIKELEKYFAGIELPAQPAILNKCSIIIDYKLFIESHIASLKANNGKRTFLPYLNRLQELKQFLTINSN